MAAASLSGSTSTGSTLRPVRNRKSSRAGRLAGSAMATNRLAPRFSSGRAWYSRAFFSSNRSRGTRSRSKAARSRSGSPNSRAAVLTRVHDTAPRRLFAGGGRRPCIGSALAGICSRVHRIRGWPCPLSLAGTLAAGNGSKSRIGGSDCPASARCAETAPFQLPSSVPVLGVDVPRRWRPWQVPVSIQGGTQAIYGDWLTDRGVDYRGLRPRPSGRNGKRPGLD